ncbi:hypothetical protein A2382_00725 [Candidatus Woesebacteria bacterium RIFOXYB1_FULL_38_16]|uniref:DUF5667 domain-containing protein n=1 Tax=Candidatus Woesebacteria bacterium RIFOXYB1_FULL_38_16 TaxID=1802538 RepID=A0A1F8CSJ5_9BACT|nr:MAG: hypothetical protein A2191_00455 [Candidatus Woesebacteria bacterium RIFOXYA1_FULL_38_9]OGM79294.1 MAG: hypothetical protein A2382_00725 [Candidatus Woesebacteria bacterium RIFOXYB1_FULL_38_16]
MLKQIFTLALLTTLFITFPSHLKAQDVTPEKINPSDSYSYSVKRLKEKLSFFFAFSKEKKYTHYQKMLDRRLSELDFILTNKDGAYIQTATQRYSAHAGKLTEFLISSKLTNHYEETINKFLKHRNYIERLSLQYDTTTAEWRFVKYDLDYLDTYTSQLKE